MINMVGQCENLYESDSACGTLYITVDDSKFLLNFTYSVKVLLDVTVSNEFSCSSKYEGNVSNVQSDSQNSRNYTSNAIEDFSSYKLLSDQRGRASNTPKEGKTEGSKRSLTLNGDSEIENDSSQSIGKDRSKTSGGNVMVSNKGDDAVSAKKRKIHDSGIVHKHWMPESRSSSSSKPESKENVSSISYPNHQYLHESNDTDTSSIQEEINDSGVVSQTGKKTTSNASNSNLCGQKISTCRDCYTNFETTQALKDHRKVKTRDIKCDECLEVFQYQAFLQVHKLSNHSKSGASYVQKDNQYWYRCDMCGALAESLVKLQIHNLVHTGEGAFQCCLCPQQFWEMKELSEHVTQSHRLSWKVRCWTCNKWFENRAARSRHKINCCRFKCHLCNEVFTHKTIRNQHFNDVHPNEVLKCKLCKHMFSTQEELDVHTDNHSKRKKKQCPTCGLLFNDVRRHMLTHKNPSELSESDYIYCDKCPERYSNKSSYNRHQRLKHPPDNSYKCTNCPKAFGHHEPLRRHMRRCKPILPHACQLCSEKYASLDQLNSHMLSHPNNIESSSINNSSSSNFILRCPLCSQSFVHRNSLEAHMQMKHQQLMSNRLINPNAASLLETGKDAQDTTTPTTYDNTTPFVYSTNGLMEAVIQGITDLANAPAPLKF